MPRPRSFIAALSFAVLAGAPFFGCGSPSSSYCSKLCDCDKCTSEQKTACVKHIDEELSAADDADCATQADDALACLEDKGSCAPGTLASDGCAKEVAAANACGLNFYFDPNSP